MGQSASAAAPGGQAGAGTSSFATASSQHQGHFNEDAFRHFRDDRGTWSQNNSRMREDDYINSNHMYARDSAPNSMGGGFTGAPRKINESCPGLPFSYTDVTRANGNPMDRAAPMDREFGRQGPSSLSQDVTRPNGPMSIDNDFRQGKHDDFSTHKFNGLLAESPRYSPSTAPSKAEASTMMSTAFLKRSYPSEEGGCVQFKIDTIGEDCQVSSRYADGPQDFKAAASNDCEAQHRDAGGMATYDEVPHHDAYGGMVTCDEPIMASPNYKQQQQQQPPPKVPLPPMQQAPPPQQRGLSQDTGCSGFSAAEVLSLASLNNMTSVSQQQQAPSNVGTSVAGAKPMNVVDELKERQGWSVGEVVEVFSSSAGKFYIGQVVQVGEGATVHMITVQFVGDNGQIMQKSMPRSDVQLAVFGRNTRQMPPGFQKVASESRPGQFSYQDTASGQKYQTKELAWQNYYASILKSEVAQQMLKQQSLTPQPAAQTAAELVAADRMKVSPLQPAPTMSVAPSAPKVTSHQYYTSYEKEGSVVGSVVSSVRGTPTTVSDLRSLSVAPQVQHLPPIVSDLVTPAQPQQSFSKAQTSNMPFPGYGKSFAVGTNDGYEAYLASQGLG